MSFKRKDLLGLAALSSEEIALLLEAAEPFKEVSGREIKKVPALRGKTVVNLFFEPSTRTRTSFELAAKRLSADVVNFSPSSSSVVKGETLLDTARNIESMQADILVLRHSSAGAAEILAKNIRLSVINAGRWMARTSHASPFGLVYDSREERASSRSASGYRGRSGSQSGGTIQYSRVDENGSERACRWTSNHDPPVSPTAWGRGLLRFG